MLLDMEGKPRDYDKRDIRYIEKIYFKKDTGEKYSENSLVGLVKQGKALNPGLLKISIDVNNPRAVSHGIDLFLIDPEGLRERLAQMDKPLPLVFHPPDELRKAYDEMKIETFVPVRERGSNTFVPLVLHSQNVFPYSIVVAFHNRRNGKLIELKEAKFGLEPHERKDDHPMRIPIQAVALGLDIALLPIYILAPPKN